MDYSLVEISNLVDGKLIGTNQRVSNIVFDSRIPFVSNGILFIAISTEKNDGHNFIELAYNKGAKCFLVSQMPKSRLPEASFVLVEDTIGALHKLAANYRKGLCSQVISITGSNGKTTVKEWLYQILNGSLVVYKSPKSYNSQLGVALSVLQPQKAIIRS